MKKNLLILISVFIANILSTKYLHAAPYTPQSADEIIAHWSTPQNDTLQSIKADSRLKPNDPTIIVALANVYLAQASQPGQSRLYGLAQAALKPLIEKNSDNENVWLAWAQVQQHQHNFDIAQAALKKVLEQNPTNENANLLAARIYIIQENPLAARNACLKLLGTTDLYTVTACSLEANSYVHPENIGTTYQQLADLINRQGLPKDERAAWLIQLLADLAFRNNDFKSASEWLAQDLKNASVNYLAQWADVQLALKNFDAVLAHIAPIVAAAPEVDDALLLRLAIAEKNTNTKSTQWQTQLTERVNLREQRQDSLHASEMAAYYLDINFNAQKALHWAKINIVKTREYSDKRLLERAEQVNQSQTTHSKGIQ